MMIGRSTGGFRKRRGRQWAGVATGAAVYAVVMVFGFLDYGSPGTGVRTVFALIAANGLAPVVASTVSERKPLKVGGREAAAVVALGYGLTIVLGLLIPAMRESYGRDIFPAVMYAGLFGLLSLPAGPLLFGGIGYFGRRLRLANDSQAPGGPS